MYYVELLEKENEDLKRRLDTLYSMTREAAWTSVDLRDYSHELERCCCDIPVNPAEKVKELEVEVKSLKNCIASKDATIDSLNEQIERMSSDEAALFSKYITLRDAIKDIVDPL